MNNTNFIAPVFLLTGLSGAGKTTLAQNTAQQLKSKNLNAIMLDGDIMRKSLCADVGFSLEDRTESLRRVAHVAKLFAEQGFITLCSCIAPLASQRIMFNEIVGENYHEIFINCPLEVCQSRDVKGLYAKVKAGKVKEYTGIASPYEKPDNANLVISTNIQSEQESIATLLNYILNVAK